jgi:hypothetical protein
MKNVIIRGLKLALGIIICMIIIGTPMIGIPKYKVWQQGLSGQAELRKAEQTRRILVEQAKAEEESAEIRARAISIMGKAAKDFPEYRLQEFLGAFAEALQNGDIEKIIYVPTEANIPIMEATRHHTLDK